MGCCSRVCPARKGSLKNHGIIRVIGLLGIMGNGSISFHSRTVRVCLQEASCLCLMSVAFLFILCFE